MDKKNGWMDKKQMDGWKKNMKKIWMVGWIKKKKQMDGWMDKKIYEKNMDGWMDKKNEKKDGWLDGWMKKNGWLEYGKK